jgi:hypothetical protein
MKSLRWSLTVNVILATAIVSLLVWIATLDGMLKDSTRRIKEEHLHHTTCPPVQVTCVCPDYEDGWEDAEHAVGCDPDSGFDIEELRALCEDLETYGYVPSC